MTAPRPQAAKTLKIEDYGMIGDCETAALVGRDGSIDWLCLPRFDSGACFAKLLGTSENGYWRIAPVGEITATRRQYRGDTLVLETEFETAEGAVTLVDCMPLRATHPEVTRIVVGRRGAASMRMELVIRFDYGSILPWVRQFDHAVRATAGPDTLVLRTPVATRGEGMMTIAEFTVRAGEEIPFSLTWSPSHEEPPTPRLATDAVRATEKWWLEWAGRCQYEGPWRGPVVRSLITLRALMYDPTGGMVAAPTSSLPESIGGVRNWDYRYCWLRDATFTLLALLLAGYEDEAAAWRNWLLRAVAGNPADLQILYSVTGEHRLSEQSLDWLEGYEGSRPVHIGNAASEQFQLDVYGEVLQLLYECRRHEVHSGGGDSWRVELGVLEFLEKAWRRPDHGLWEIRGEQLNFTHSKLMAWVAFDRAVRNVEQFGKEGPVDRWRGIRDEIHAEICERGFDSERNTFTQAYESSHLDASLLMMPLVGFLPADDPRIAGTIDAIQRDLTHGEFVKRYDTRSQVDGLPPGEGAFLPCSFWLVDALAVIGRGDDARALFERLLGVCNDLGLVSEEYDPTARRLVGNFPQAFTHVGLVAAAYYLADPDLPKRVLNRMD